MKGSFDFVNCISLLQIIEIVLVDDEKISILVAKTQITWKEKKQEMFVYEQIKDHEKNDSILIYTIREGKNEKEV